MTLSPFLGERTPRISYPRVPVSWRSPVKDLGSNTFPFLVYLRPRIFKLVYPPLIFPSPFL